MQGSNIQIKLHYIKNTLQKFLHFFFVKKHTHIGAGSHREAGGGPIGSGPKATLKAGVARRCPHYQRGVAANWQPIL
jgi:hypothetical protein